MSIIDQTTEIFRPADHDELAAAVEAYITKGDRTYGPIGTWDTSGVRDMSGIFRDYLSRYQDFDEDISGWDTSSVTDMSNMFWCASNLNQQLDTHTVTRPDGTTYMAWDVSRVTNMTGMFWGASNFNQSLSNWDVSSITDTSSMFFEASSFNQPLSMWNISNVNNMNLMFTKATMMLQKFPNIKSNYYEDITCTKIWSEWFPRKKPTKSATKLANRPTGPGEGSM